jgi:hypothetical protein
MDGQVVYLTSGKLGTSCQAKRDPGLRKGNRQRIGERINESERGPQTVWTIVGRAFQPVGGENRQRMETAGWQTAGGRQTADGRPP